MKNWLKNSVFYEIYPQSFKDSNADGIGDFNGIIQKLDYIKDMGFTAIWMNPCFVSPFTDAGYDVEDFYNVAPRYGTNEDIKHLFDEIHKRDMHIILDLVPGHTSLSCPWFKESMKPEKNEYSDRYIWTDSIWKNCDGIPGITGTLRGVSQRDGSCAVNFFSTQPALNYGFAKITESWQSSTDSEAVVANRKEIINIMKFWLGMGCDGFRIDSAHLMVKNDEERVGTIKLWQTVLREVAEDYPDAVFVSEWGEPDKSLLSGFDMDFLLHFGPTCYMNLFRENPYFSANGEGDVEEFFRVYMNNLKLTEDKGYICIPSGNHDMTRIAHHLDDTQLKLAYAFIMSMPGVPFIYYGDEIGMRYIEGINSVEGGFHRTGSRSPMQWDDSTNAGFSTASPDKLYIQIDSSEDRPTVSSQLKEKNSILNELKQIISVRKSNSALQESGKIEIVNTKGYPLIYKRYNDNQTVLICINPCNKEVAYDLNLGLKEVIYEFNGIVKSENGKLIIPPCSASYISI